MTRTAQWILLGAAFAVAGTSFYLALDARSDAEDAIAAAHRLARAQARFAPTLVVQQRNGEPITGRRVAASGEVTNVDIFCEEGSVAVGGGFNTLDAVTVAGSFPQGGSGGRRASGDGWFLRAYDESGGRGRIAPFVLCARGEGGLRVRSTAASESARP